MALTREFPDAKTAIETYRAETGCIDQDLQEFVIAENGAPVGTVKPGDSVILFNFRGDRALEISRAMDDPNFDKFDRGEFHDVLYAGMLEYDGDAHIPSRYLVEPPDIEHTLTELLVSQGINEYALSETQKYGHVTYFWNGNRSGKVDEKLETYEEIPSDNCPFNEKPAMKCAEITDHLIAAMESGKFGFLRCNFPNGDMVGHTGDFDAVVTSMEALDTQLGPDRQSGGSAGLCAGGDCRPRKCRRNAGEKQEGPVSGAHGPQPQPGALCDLRLERRTPSGGLRPFQCSRHRGRAFGAAGAGNVGKEPDFPLIFREFIPMQAGKCKFPLVLSIKIY